MKEKALSDKQIIKTLNKTGYLIIETICGNCIHNVIQLVMDNFKEQGMNFSVYHITSDLYCLTISINPVKDISDIIN